MRFFTVPEFSLRIILGEGAGTVLGRANVKSEKTRKAGDRFLFVELDTTLINLLRK